MNDESIKVVVSGNDECFVYDGYVMSNGAFELVIYQPSYQSTSR